MIIAVCAWLKKDRLNLQKMLCRRLNELCAEAEIRLFADGESLLEAFEPGAFAVLYIDADLPDEAALKVSNSIRNSDQKCKIVFFAENDKYAQKVYASRPADYLIKPVEYESFCNSFDRCEESWRDCMKYIEIKANRIVTRIRLAEIVCVEVRGRTCVIHKSAAEITENCPLTLMEKTLGGAPFFRCHKSFIVNANHITEKSGTEYVMDNGMRVPASHDKIRTAD